MYQNAKCIPGLPYYLHLFCQLIIFLSLINHYIKFSLIIGSIVESRVPARNECFFIAGSESKNKEQILRNTKIIFFKYY